MLLHFKKRIVACLGSIAFQTARAAPIPNPSTLKTIASSYSEFRDKAVSQWPLKNLLPIPSAGIDLKALTKEGNAFYIGVEQVLKVDAPLKDVEGVLDDFDNYKSLFEGFRSIQVTSRDSASVLTFWEQIVPIPFVSNVRYSMLYRFDKSHPNRKIYIYSLTESKDLKVNDGVIVIESLNEKSTVYREFDFWDANWGLAKSLAPTRIWKDSIEGVALADLSIKFRAENPKMSFEKIHQMAHAYLSAKQLDSIAKGRASFKESDYLPSKP